MTAKRASPRKATTKAKTKTKTPVAALTERAVLTILESAAHAAANPPPMDADLRRQMVAAAAYFLAERRGFAAGHDLEDWLAAESVVDSRLQQTHAA